MKATYPKSHPPVKWIKAPVSSDTHEALKKKANQLGLVVTDAIELALKQWVEG